MRVFKCKVYVPEDPSSLWSVILLVFWFIDSVKTTYRKLLYI